MNYVPSELGNFVEQRHINKDKEYPEYQDAILDLLKHESIVKYRFIIKHNEP